MIILEKLSWGNAFSYGKENSIDLNSTKLLQLIGKNGHGKTSIGLVLEEVLFNTNSKKVKRADILNRNTTSKSYWITLKFTKIIGSEVHYEINTVRGTTQTVKLLEDGIDISEHTATATYKLIESIIGMDHKTFTQVVNQSSAFSLEFLTATDSARKKFLIEFFNLNKYTKASEYFKQLAKDHTLLVESVNTKLNTINTWITNISKTDLVKKPILEVPEGPNELRQQVAEINQQLSTITETNKQISQVNTYINILNNLSIVSIPEKPISNDEIVKLKVELASIRKENIEDQTTIQQKLNDRCNSCGQVIDITHKRVLVDRAKERLSNNKTKAEGIQTYLAEQEKKELEYKRAVENNTNWEHYYNLVNGAKEQELVNEAYLKTELQKLNKQIKDLTDHIANINKINNDNTTHNTKIDVILGQMKSMQDDLDKYKSEHTKVSNELNNIQLLTKTFSTTGLVAYKIECLVKDLEDTTNKYLLELGDGRFQISFKMNSSDKLNVIITDNGRDIDILCLSNGELARVNLASLLAIRKIIQDLSNCRINLLILDETIDSLDLDGKEKLIEILLEEEHLNTILISHGFKHPLIVGMNIVKENEISRIENG